ncbi:uncharacterized protein [Dysidea avara]|uniref:uncharacterized protein isoform X2 n=1 Tax=Dysidea avara TaxID=196820 RepID=UPI00332994D1
MWSSLPTLTILILFVSCLFDGTSPQKCSEEIAGVYDLMKQIDSNITTTLYVDDKNGTDMGNCSDINTPCKTIWYALQMNKSNNNNRSFNNLKVIIKPGFYTLREEYFYYSTNVVLEGSSDTTITCGKNISIGGSCLYENFAFYYSTNIVIRNFTFLGCGPDPSSHYIFGSSNIILDSNVYINNTAPAVIAYFTDSIYVINSNFSYNIIGSASSYECLDSSERLFFRDNVTSAGGVSVFSHNHTQKVIVLNSHFDNNHARNNTQINSVPPQLKRFGHGGGLSLRLVNSSGGFICVVNSSFSDNKAEVGGGAISITLVESDNNNVMFSGVTFENNLCFYDKCIGGAISIDLFDRVQQNRFRFSYCDFINNHAAYGSGGAISVASADKGFSDDGSDEYKLLELLCCNFSNNVALFEGTAVGLFSLGHVNDAGFRTLIENCTFLDNTSDKRDIPAVTAYRVLIEVDGYNAFNRNIGGGVTLLNSRIDVKGHIDFYNNTAVFGGGISLSGRCLILLYKDSVLHFEGNYVTGSGAGIYLVHPTVSYVLPILNRGCFIQYHSGEAVDDVPPNQWETRVEFINNRADSGGSAVFATDLGRCDWLGDVESDSTTFIFNPKNTTNSPFNLTSDLPDTMQCPFLGTDPSNITATSQQKDDSSYGEKIVFHLATRDDVGNFRQAVFTVQGPGNIRDLGALSRENSTIAEQIPNMETLESDLVKIDNNTTNVSFEFDLLNSQGERATVDVKVLGSCHPGYQLNKNTQKCECDISDKDVVRCDGLGRYVYIRDGIWADDNDDQLFPLFTLPIFLNCTRDGGSDLPGCLYKYDSPNEQCSNGREGDLCSRCKQGYGVTLDLRYCDDNLCGVAGVIIFSLACLFFILFSSLALFFNFTLPNELRGFLFFAQVIGLIYRNRPYLAQTSGFVYVLANLLGFSLPIPSCFLKNMSALNVALLSLVPPLLVTITILLYVFSARFVFVKQLSNRTSIHGIVLLSLFVYKYVADTTLILISCRKIHHKNKLVFQYDTDQNCLEFPMVLFVLLAILTLVFFVLAIPFVILVSSKKQHSLRILKQISYFRDALTIGIKGDCYWFSAWDIFRRLPFIVTVFMATQLPSSLILSVFILVVFTVHCVSKPYEKEYINVIEMIILGLLFLTTIAILDADDIYIGRGVGIVLLCIPFLYALIFISIRPSKWMWDKCCKKHYQVVKRKMESRQHNINSQHGDLNLEFVLVKKPKVDEPLDVVDTSATHCTFLREPLLNDVS